jgi:HAD superfamily hydrolase (TIGR01509 family)
MHAKAVIFDLDGTILDSEPWHKKAEIEAFSALGYTVSEPDLIPYVGTTLVHMLGALAPGLKPEAFLEVEQPILTGYIRTEMAPFQDAVDLIDRLRVPCALATSSMKWYLDETSRRFPFLHNFVCRYCASDVTHGKPHPEMFLLACAGLGVAPGDTLVIEDSRNGILAALAAGCQVIGIDRHGLIDLGEAHEVRTSLEGL